MSTLVKLLGFLIILWCSIITESFAQSIGLHWNQLSNVREDQFLADSNFIQLDSNGVIPSTFIIKMADNDSLLSANSYYLEPFTGKLRINDSLLYGKNLKIYYRILPVQIKSVYKKKNFGGYTWRDSTYLDPYFYDPNYALKENPIDFGGLNYNGAFARGISFGNNQDLVVNSTLDLQLSGKIGDLEILAALTDNTIPIQPDGTTQQIQDFDKVYIQVKKGPHQFTAGDYGLQSRESYFVKFDKQLQGASFSTGFDFKKGWHTKHSASFAIAKGKFARNTFNGKEGNQGPYKLLGNNGETYIIILAGSEKVYSDGKLLQRGENNAYIMDYNTGEIVFTPNFLVTKDVRLVVEFEYSDKNYFRTLFHTSHEVNYKGLNLYAQFYSEQDSKNKPILANVDSSTRAILRNVGNDISKAFVPGVRPADYAANSIQYQMKDTLINGILYDSVFVYTNQSDIQLYNLSFSYVGAGLGNYSTDKNSLNQRVYRWIAPVNGLPQGEYEPIELIITPKKDMYAVLGARYHINSKTSIYSEWAFSNRDLNTFSDINNKDNKGWALMNKVERRDTLGQKKWLLSSKAMYELKSENFQAPEQYRSVEFSRDWNVNSTVKAQEHFVTTAVDLRNADNGFQVGGSWNYFNRKNILNGIQQIYHLNYNKNNWDLRAEMNWLQNKDLTLHSTFLRPNIQISRKFPKLKYLEISTGAFSEYNAIKNNLTDTLLSSAYYNNNVFASVKTSDSAFISGDITYKFRNDLTPNTQEFKSLSSSNDIEVNAKANRLKNQNLSIGFTFRDLKINDSIASGQQSDKNFLGRAEYGFLVKRGAIRLNTIYELGSGQERVREFTYLEVSSGQGLYKWIDQNGDGIQQLDEFVIAQFADSANYVRVLTNVNEYIQARIVTFNQVLQLNPKAVWFDVTGIKKFIARFNLNSSMVITRKTFKGSSVSPFNPFLLNTNDENVLSLNSAFRNSVYFNQGSPKFYANYTWFFNQNKTILVNGFDTRKRQEQTLESNYNLPKGFSLNMKLLKGRNFADAEYSTSNNYDIGQYNINPSMSWILKTILRTSIGYEYNRKKNIPELGNELAKGNKLNFEIRYSIVSKQTIEAKFSFVLFDYNGVNGTTKSYQILDGLQPGKNYIWNATYNRTLSNNLQLNISYEGRKTGNSDRIVHTGSASLRALF